MIKVNVIRLKTLSGVLRNNCGVSAVIVAIVIVVLVGFAALAIDIGHLAVVRNELQNAADAGALNGARVLYITNADGELMVNTGADAEAIDAAIANYSDKTAVEVNPSEVQRGHWDLTSREFTPSDATGLLDDFSEDDVINAIRVTTRRSSAISFLANIFGISSFPSQASAIAYRGYAGDDITYDEPIAICRDAIEDPVTGEFNCNVGRMINNGNTSPDSQTARWTNFSEDCVDSANAPSINNRVCSGSGDPVPLGSISTNNGEIESVMTNLRDCWRDETEPTNPGAGAIEPWEITLPVVECPPSESPTCSQIVGAVRVKVLWITPTGGPEFGSLPVSMTGWEGWSEVGGCTGDGWSASSNCSGLTPGQCWDNFATCFNIRIDNGDLVPYMNKTIYFAPGCEYVEGGTGGEDFGVMSELPVLVQ